MAGSIRMCSYETAILLDYTSPAVISVIMCMHITRFCFTQLTRRGVRALLYC